MKFILAVHSPNGTNSASDRKAIQDEIDQLTTEIDRVSETTKFNETYLLKGDSKKNGNTAAVAASGKVGDIAGLTVTAKAAEIEVKDGDEITLGTVALKSSNVSVVSGVIADDDLAKKVASVKVTKSDSTVANQIYDVTDKDGNVHSGVTNAKLESEWGLTGVASAPAGAEAVISKTLKNEGAAGNFGDVTGTYTGNLKNADVGDTVKAIANVGSDGKISLSQGTKALNFSLHVGADSSGENKISVNIDSMSSKGIGVDGIDVSTEKAATEAIDTISAAIAKVSEQRSSLGAIQNRLEHTIANLDNVVENTTAAESRIRDTDMAKEMVNFSKNNILAQAGQSMLAQANQSNQGVLSLLQ